MKTIDEAIEDWYDRRIEQRDFETGRLNASKNNNISLIFKFIVNHHSLYTTITSDYYQKTLTSRKYRLMELSEELSSGWDDKEVKDTLVAFSVDYSSIKKLKRILKWLNQKWKEWNWERTAFHSMWR